MSVRTKVLGLVDVLMRVPSLFVIDEILKISMGFSSSMHQGVANITEAIINETDPLPIEYYKTLSLSTLKIFTCLLGKISYNLLFFHILTIH